MTNEAIIKHLINWLAACLYIWLKRNSRRNYFESGDLGDNHPYVFFK